jgi:hypothetical protein
LGDFNAVSTVTRLEKSQKLEFAFLANQSALDFPLRRPASAKRAKLAPKKKQGEFGSGFALLPCVLPG